MPVRDSWATGTSTFDAEEVRVANAAPWTPGTNAVKALTGIKPGPADPGGVTATGTPNGFVHVAPFTAIIQSSRATNAGVYPFVSDTIVDINILSTPANATNPRNDLVICHQPDTFYSDANSTGVVRAVVGTPSGSPADPSLAAFPDAITLARVRVDANATTIVAAKITDLRPAPTVAVGGVLPTATATTRNALTGIYDGAAIYRRDRNWIETYDGTAYRVESLPVVSSVADLTAITAPYAGQVASCTGDGMQYRYTGSAWVPHGVWRTSTKVTTPVASLSFTVPVNLKNLEIRYTARSSAAAPTDVMYMRINNNSTASTHLSTLSQLINITPSYTVNAGGTTAWFIANIAGSTAVANFFGSGVIHLQGWDGPHATLGATWNGHVYADTSSNAILCSGGGMYNAFGPYTTLQIFPSTGNNFLADTRVDVYGFE